MRSEDIRESWVRPDWGKLMGGWVGPEAIPGKQDGARLGTNVRELRRRYRWYGEMSREEGLEEETRKYLKEALLPGYVKALNKIDKWWIINSFKILPKVGGMIGFRPRPFQEKIIAAVGEQKAAGEPVRLLALKPRQVGLTTVETGILYTEQREKPWQHQLIVSNTSRSVYWINLIYRRFCIHDVVEKDWEARPTKVGVEFRGINAGGDVTIVPAKFAESTLGQTRPAVLFDELAFWPNFEEMWASTMQIIPNEPETMLLCATTPYGFGAGFHQLWNRKDDGFMRVFSGWWEDPTYEMKIATDEERERLEGLLNKDMRKYGNERAEIERYGLTLEQIKWRRFMIDTSCLGHLNRFRMWYPANEQEGFIGTGRKFFEFDLVTQWEAARAAATTLSLWDLKVSRNEMGMVIDAGLVEKTDGRIKIYRAPRYREPFVMGVDTASGEIVDDGNREPDRSCIQVLSRGSLKRMEGMGQVAVFNGHIEPDLLGWMVYALGKHFNNAWAAIEKNQHGSEVIKTAMIKYANYLVGDPNKKKPRFDMTKLRQRSDYGITTSPLTRPLMLGELSKTIRDGMLGLADEETIKEMDTFVLDEKGKPMAQKGCHDDRVMSLALAVVSHTQRWIPAIAWVEKSEEETLSEKARSFFNRVRKMKEGDSLTDPAGRTFTCVG